MREVPAKTTTCRKIRIVAGRRFWRFLLVDQLPLSIMAVHAQYRATAPLSIDDERDDDDELRRKKTGSRTSFTAGKFAS